MDGGDGMSEPTQDPPEDIGHTLPQELWDELDHDALEAEEPDPAKVAYAKRVVEDIEP